jgi:hypothetical protein
MQTFPPIDNEIQIQKQTHITHNLPWKPKWENQHSFGFDQALYYSTMGKLHDLWFISMLLSDIWVASLHHSHPKEPLSHCGET